MRRVQFFPDPCPPPASNPDPRLWGTDQNAKMLRRQLQLSAQANPYSCWYRRQGLMELAAVSLSPDPYLVPVQIKPCPSRT